LANTRLYKLLHWEYWPLLAFYIPNIPYAFVHGLAARNLVFYTAVNPGILNSGIGSESKYATLHLLPKEYIPKSVLHQENSAIEDTIKEIKNQEISYPLIVKPDVGFRGLLVKKIENEEDLSAYLQKYPVAFIIQEFLTHAHECGIFYYRHPNEEKGKVTSITLKEFLTINGDGTSTIKELVLSDDRAFLYYNFIKHDPLIDWNFIPQKGKSIKLSSIGNHSKGTRFINGNHLINKELEESLNKLNHQVNGWFYGRLDVKYHSLEELNQGKFKVLELNGILAEPTHIYDATNMSYWKALKTIRTHWKQLYRIARYNHKHQHIAYRKVVPFLKEMFALKAYSNRLKKLSQQ
jgi:hypothetical protein